MTLCSVHAMASQTFTFPLPRSERVILLASWLVGLALPGMWVRLVLRKAHVALRELPNVFAGSLKLQVIAALAVVLYAAAAFVAVWYIRVARGTLLTVTDEGFTWFVPGAPLSGGGEQKVSVVWSEVRRLRLRTLRSYRYQTFALTVETDQGTVLLRGSVAKGLQPLRPTVWWNDSPRRRALRWSGGLDAPSSRIGGGSRLGSGGAAGRRLCRGRCRGAGLASCEQRGA